MHQRHVCRAVYPALLHMRAEPSQDGQAPGKMLASHHVYDCWLGRRNFSIQYGLQMHARATQALSPDARRVGIWSSICTYTGPTLRGCDRSRLAASALGAPASAAGAATALAACALSASLCGHPTALVHGS